jgi:hypothetical protein
MACRGEEDLPLFGRGTIDLQEPQIAQISQILRFRAAHCFNPSSPFWSVKLTFQIGREKYAFAWSLPAIASPRIDSEKGLAV